MTKQCTGDELIVFDDMPIGKSLSDYWRWNASDLLNNTLRGSYCEFIVSAALGVDLSGTNDDWTPYDISFPYNWVCNGESRDKVRIEVKSCAYLQAWRQGDGRLSSIQFSIRPTRAWDSISGYAEEVKRQSDVYVFCLYTETVRERADPLVLDGWDFYIVPTHILDEQCGPQKTISLTMLQKLDPYLADYGSIRDAVVDSLNVYPPPDILHSFYHSFLCITEKQPRTTYGAAFSSAIIIFWRFRNGLCDEEGGATL